LSRWLPELGNAKNAKAEEESSDHIADAALKVIAPGAGLLESDQACPAHDLQDQAAGSSG
jgi:hypothetical protein